MVPRFVFALAILTTGFQQNHAAEPRDIDSRLELFVDDFLIDSLLGGVTQQVQQPTPNQVVLVTDEPWEGNTCAYYTIFRDGDLYRMYYRGAHGDLKTQKSLHREVTCYAESHDGIHFTKPKLGLFDWDGSKTNNIVLDGLGTHCFVAFRDDNPNCPADAKYKGISRGTPAGLYIFKSPDGIRWTQIQQKAVITNGAFDSQNLAFFDASIGKYRAYWRYFAKGVRAIRTSTSQDLIHWEPDADLAYGDAPNQHLYTNAIRSYDRAPHLLIGFPTRYLPAQSQVEPIFMSSRDGVNFHRWNEAVIPRTAPKDRQGNRSNYMANGLVRLGDNNREYAVYASEAYYTGPDTRLRRFTYRTDGFVAIQADEDGGELLTRPLTFDGEELALNYATHDDGYIRVELLDSDGTAIDGLELSKCEKLNGDEIEHVVRWNGASSVSRATGKPTQIRFSMKNASLYSIRFR